MSENRWLIPVDLEAGAAGGRNPDKSQCAANPQAASNHISASTYSLFWSEAILKKFLIAEKLTYAMKSEPNIELQNRGHEKDL